jgi:phenylacetate-CoA ligase
MGLFTGGLGFLNGAETLGATLVPSGSGQTERQIILIQDFKTTVIFSTPSYALTIAEKAGELGINLRESSLRIGIFGAEPWSEEMRREIEERLGIEAMEAYGLTEMGGPGVAFSCREKKGLHINEDHFIAEIIDPVTEEPLPLGEEGELVLTAIQRRAMPLIRYRVRDLTRLYREPCGCGRTFLKMERVRARSDDMLIVNGVNLFPSQIESLLLEFPELSPHYVIVVSKHGYLDRLAIDVEARREIYDLGEEKLREIEVRVQNRIKGIIGLSARVRIVPYKIIERSEGKAKRVIDQRP